jgi:hypothetical protein
MAPIFESGRLLSMRGLGDSVADDIVVAALIGETPEQAARTLERLTRALRRLDDTPEVTEWIQRVEPSPPWRQEILVAQGQELFTEWSIDVVTSLFCASLPFAYAAAQGVEVLDRISQLADPGTVARRIAETGQMLLDVSERGALASGGRGYETARTVRLLHAVIRARLTSHTFAMDTGRSAGTWDTLALGVPVNQEDLLGTLLSFTTIVFRAFDRMGIPWGEQAQESYLQLWAAIGHLLGIESSEAVLNPREAEALTDLIAQELHARSIAGIHLMEVLMDEMELSMPWGLRKLPRTLVRHLAGDQTADLLDVAPSAWWSGLLPALAALNRVTGRWAGGRAILQAPSRLLGRSMIRMWIDRSLLGEGSSHIHIAATRLADLGVRVDATRTGVGLRGRLRGFRRTLRRRQLHIGRPSTTDSPSTAGERR